MFIFPPSPTFLCAWIPGGQAFRLQWGSDSWHQLRVTETGSPNQNVQTSMTCSEPSHFLVESISSSPFHVILVTKRRETERFRATDNDRIQTASSGIETYEQVVISMPAQLRIIGLNRNAYIVSKSPLWICSSGRSQKHSEYLHQAQSMTSWSIASHVFPPSAHQQVDRWGETMPLCCSGSIEKFRNNFVSAPVRKECWKKVIFIPSKQTFIYTYQLL
jgi:hypothetical protein